MLGWPPLLGLDPWVMPEPQVLVEQFGADLVADLIGILDAHRPPHVDEQYQAERAPRPLPKFSQLVAGEPYKFGPGSEIERSEIIIRPLQVLTMAVASDTLASLALGFGTGAPLGKRSGEQQTYDDFMVTAPWHGHDESPPSGSVRHGPGATKSQKPSNRHMTANWRPSSFPHNAATRRMRRHHSCRPAHSWKVRPGRTRSSPAR